MKKMKGVAAMVPPPYASYEDPRTTFKHHNLLQDYRELHKETEGVKETLKRMKQKKLTLLEEVRFLRRRYKYLIKKRSTNPNHKQEVQSRNKRNHSAKEAARALGIDLNQKGMFGNGGKDAALLNVKERACNEEEAVMRNRTPVFDLNQISREEEEALNGGALRYEEPEKSSMRIVSENDTRLSVCRDIGNGNSGAGKRKNAWQDQVALRADGSMRFYI